MVDYSPPAAPPVPALGKQVATLLLRHAAGGVGVWLVAQGYLGSKDVDAFTSEATGLALFVLALLLSVMSKLAMRSKFLAALWADPPGAVVVSDGKPRPPSGGTGVQRPTGNE